MEAKGRKGDSMLVHMTPDEVAGLQALAQRAGGSLTVNPETGLVEANFLKRMLPTLVGIGLGMTGVGLPAAMAAGALTGGIQAKRNDQDVGLGAVLGGLGAMGGANLASGLAAAGSSAASNVAGNVAGNAAANATGTAAGQQVGQQVAQDTATQALTTSTPTTSVFGDGTSMQFFDDGSRQVIDAAGNITSTPATDVVPGAGQPTFMMDNDGSTLITTQPGGFDAAGQPIQPSVYSTPGTDVVQPATATSRFEQIGRGIENMGTDRGQEAFATKFGTKSAMAGAAPLLAPEKMETPEEIEEDDEMILYDFKPGQTGQRSSNSSEVRQLANEYTNRRKVKAKDYFSAKGGLLSLAEGGVAEAAAPTQGMTGASADAFNYLMGQSDMSPVARSALAAQSGYDNFTAPAREFGKDISSTKGYTKVAEGPNAGMYQGEAQYGFDPKAQQYYRTDKLFKYVEPAPTGTDYNFYGTPGIGDMTSRYDQTYYAQRANHEGGNAAGGLLSLAKGGMKSGGFVIPADVVSMIGEGNTDAGYSRIKSMVPGATAIKGKDGGQADTVKTSIEGKQPARVAHGEMYVPPETVKRMGGAKKLYAMMDRVRHQATGSKKQIKPVSLKKALA
jgi:hypothetical protein